MEYTILILLLPFVSFLVLGIAGMKLRPAVAGAIAFGVARGDLDGVLVAVMLLLAGLGVAGEVFCHDSPQQAMQAAREAAAESDRILAFGSFYTVAGALQVLGRTA